MFIGNPHIKDYFEKIVKLDSLSHAYLFYGPEGAGKKFLVLKLAEKLLGNLNNSPDLKIIDKGGDQIYISDIRELRNFLYLTSFGKYKVAIINNAHSLNQEASNALLKVLEEPPGKTIIFFITHLEKVLLPTIISRCQLIRFKPLKKSEIIDYLVEEKRIKKETAKTAAKFANGSLGLALELANNFNNFQKNINLLNKLLKADFMERLETSKKISADSESLKKTAGDWFLYSASLPEKKLAKELLHLNSILAKSQFNRRLFLDNFLINI